MSQDNFEQYFRTQQISLQWLPVLRSLSIELERHASVEDLRILFSNTGKKFAEEIAPRCEGISTLSELQETLNEFWMQLNWGWVEISESSAVVQISHQAAPLAEAFGESSLAWSVGLLEGFYDEVFKLLGASADMHVSVVMEESTAMSLRLELGR